MKNILFISILLFLFSCKKDNDEMEKEDNPTFSIYKAWTLSLQTYDSLIGDSFIDTIYVDPISGVMFSGMIQDVNSVSNVIMTDTVFSNAFPYYYSRVWSINSNQSIIETFYDDNGFAYNTLYHTFIKNVDTLKITFQSGKMINFLINDLNIENFNISAITDTSYVPIVKDGVYQDTVLITFNRERYFFNELIQN